MLTITPEAWRTMVAHAREAYPRECCGVLLGTLAGEDERTATVAVACRNAYEGERRDRFVIDPSDQLVAQKRARAEDLEVLGFFHSHPDEEAYFSATDLAHSWPWYSNVVLSVRGGALAGAACFRADEARTRAEPEGLAYPVE